jgi:hypothetical protein
LEEGANKRRVAALAEELDDLIDDDEFWCFQARTGDAVAISAYLGKSSRFATALRDFARLYADQNERDHARLERAIAAGAVESAPGW